MVLAVVYSCSAIAYGVCKDLTACLFSAHAWRKCTWWTDKCTFHYPGLLNCDSIGFELSAMQKKWVCWMCKKENEPTSLLWEKKCDLVDNNGVYQYAVFLDFWIG